MVEASAKFKEAVQVRQSRSSRGKLSDLPFHR